jgi:hypothetical protein
MTPPFLGKLGGQHVYTDRRSARYAHPVYQEPGKGSNTNIGCIRLNIRLLGTYSSKNKRTPCLHNQDQRAESPQQPNYGSTFGAHCSLGIPRKEGVIGKGTVAKQLPLRGYPWFPIVWP